MMSSSMVVIVSGVGLVGLDVPQVYLELLNQGGVLGILRGRRTGIARSGCLSENFRLPVIGARNIHVIDRGEHLTRLDTKLPDRAAGQEADYQDRHSRHRDIEETPILLFPLAPRECDVAARADRAAAPAAIA